ncbi:hypothetical protein TRAPUB_12107 [Trametes pubescens]|uniref:RGS domain-containing protein n=1 Tax=Trametes pubescens TaxID=154538 RepID=A0A1M2VV46_TRAPU|nr:hypothetical protein TRAPUB_12107 [Trametes pubescens]
MSRALPSDNRSTSTHTSVLSRYAAKLSRRRLAHISLANILAGHTCYPIGLADFEAYLALKEHSLENMHFAVWYQSYRTRYFALASTPQSRPQYSCKSGSFQFPLPTPARTTQRLSESRRQSYTAVSCSTSPTDSVFPGDFASPARRGFSGPPLSLTSPAPSGLPTLPYTSPSDPPNDALSIRSLRLECAHVTATFLTPDSPEELMLDAEVREVVIRELTWSIHPDVFLSVYESVVEALESFSLPRFLEHASTNINSPKQIFWYSVGIVDMLLAATVAVLLVALLPSGMGEASRRAWRLITVPLFSLGSMQAYSAWRGFCSEVWGRGNTQLRTWELEATGHEGTASSPWSSLASTSAPASPVRENKIVLSSVCEDEREGCSSHQASPSTSAPASPHYKTFAPDAHDDTATIPGLDTHSLHGRLGRKLHTFGKDADDEPQSGHAYVTSVDVRLSQAGSGESDAEPAQPLDPWGWESSSRGGTGDVQRGWEPDAKASRRRSAREEYRRPPVFGPERPVLDPHIRAVHKAVMRDMLMAGFVCTVRDS